ncbi:CHAD domain-containing protein [Nocardioides panacisoli]|uniref:CHAD domain-containing protein n=1 Tax=Nocardioides panacisoli TaxID=627624 RepID=A0ABP7I2L5_9ACTN
MAGPGTTAGEMLRAVLRDLARSVVERQPAALADEPDAVHQLRTAVRRLRNVLAAFGDLVDPATAGALRARLSAYGDRLGLARDLEVRAADVRAAADAVGLAPGPRDRLLRDLQVAHAAAHAQLVAWCRSDHGAALAAVLGTVLDDAGGVGPVGAAARPGDVVAAEVLLAQADRVLALGADHLGDRDVAHTVRKAGRRLRHVADAVATPPAAVLGDEARALGAAGATVQKLLGDHRDAGLLAEHVRSVVALDGDAAASSAMVEHAEGRAAAALADVPRALEDLAVLRARAQARRAPADGRVVNQAGDR